ncbi:type IV pilus biogenesis/stability protein PilW [Niveibacterium sp. 24ML]|uniref:type IV pilus biogenesis/stability protein PilW n=1 Tax=Niveibacterium sp. 24ML TaxID=2985512 RepID=UPI002270B320|nr:type IV pilus biogenesis/stability protein PilW [Niveibacterium sp. 24ML]MCX9155091.1 type IV pilus biogenesis/stability protein PilW [Niveibacterium sp. 24ML]
MIGFRTALLLLALAAGGTGCSSGGSRSKAGESDRPSADQPVTSDARKRSRAHVELGTEYLKAGRFGVAMEEARIAIEEDPSYAAAHQLKASVHVYLEEKKAAQDSFERALSLAPGDPELANSYGWFLCTNGERSRGLDLLVKSAQNPYYEKATRPYTNAGLCYLMDNNTEAARVQFQRAYTLDPKNTTALYNLALITYQKGDTQRAREMTTELNRIGDPTAASLWLGLRVEHKLGNREAEVAYLAQLKRRFPDSPELQDYLQGRFD